MNGSGNSIDNEKNLSNTKKLENLAKSKKAIKILDFVEANSYRTNFLTLKAQETFTYVKQTFTKTSILHDFEPKRHIYIETNVFIFAIGGIFS